MIRAAVIDGHPAMRAGVEAILARTADVVVVAATSGEPHTVEHALYRTAPDVVIIGDDPGHLDGVQLARLIKGLPSAPRIVLYAEAIDATQVGAAMLAGADALVDTRGDAAALVAAVRSAARGEPAFPELDVAALAARLPSDYRAILQLRFGAVSPREIARSLGLDAGTLRARVTAMIELLRPTGAATMPATPC